MSEPRQRRTPDEPETGEPESDASATPESATPLVVAVAPAAAGGQTSALRDAFFVLCRALEGALVEDMPACSHAQEIQAWMVNAGDDATGIAQTAQAWTHAVMLLENVLGQRITHS